MPSTFENASFSCNICGDMNETLGAIRHRELLHCKSCGSCARFRGIAKAITTEVLGIEGGVVLSNLAERKDIHGIGMSDADCYAGHLARIFDYTNTYYHTDPWLDISSSESSAQYRDLDFIISSDVLEHVRAPVSEAMRNACAMLRPGGKFILTVPYVEGHETIEHFPHLGEFQIVQLGETYVLLNKRLDGLIEMHQNLSFHGGPGSVLEMRIFGEGDLFALLATAGFGQIAVLPPNDEAVGYCWDDLVESVMTGGRRNKSYVLICTRIG